MFPDAGGYSSDMTALVTLDACLSLVLSDMAPASPDRLDLSAAVGHVLAADLTLSCALPVRSQSLRSGIAVAALDTVGASPQLPLPIPSARRVRPGRDLPQGTDAVLPEDGVEWSGPIPLAIRAISPGDGMRRTGHDGRAGQVIARAGDRLGPIGALLAAEAGITTADIRRPRVRIAMDTPHHADFAAQWARGLGATLSPDAPDLVLCTSTDDAPRLALSGAETAWLHRQNGCLMLELPARFDGMIAGLLALGLPALEALTGAVPRPVTRPLLRKAVSGPGMSDLVLLTAQPGGWHPASPGLITIAGLARAQAFAILPPDSEGLPAGADLSGHALVPFANELP